MKQNISLIKRYLMYFKERFPLVGAFLYAGSLFYMSYFSANLFYVHLPVNFLKSAIGCIVIFLVLLHLRLFDEHKDYDRDIKAHPDRLLSKGIITLNDLKKLFIGVVLLEVMFSLYLGIDAFCVWVVIMVWSYLMYVEFFAPVYLNQRMGLYLISHQLIVPMIVIFGLAERTVMGLITIADIVFMFMLSIGAICATITYEISRKTWSSEQEHDCADSYTKTWGITKTIIVNQTCAFISSIIFIGIFHYDQSSPVFTFIALILFIQFLTAELLFYKNPSKKNSKKVELSGILFLLGIFINAGICMYI